MNKIRRNKLKNIIEILEQAMENLGGLYSEEEDVFNNIPENLQGSMTYESMNDGLNTMQEAIDEIENIIDNLRNFAE